MTKKYTDIELYLLLREKAQLVEKTKFAVLDKTFKTCCAEKTDISIFSILGILMDLQALSVVLISHPNVAKNKVSLEELSSFIVRNLSRMKHTYRKIDGIASKPLVNWLTIGSTAFESTFADFIDYLQNDLDISLVLPLATTAVIDDLNPGLTKKHNIEISFT